MLLYYITDRAAFPGDESTRRRHLLDKIAEAASARIDYIQLREKDLSARALEALAKDAAKIIRETNLPATHYPPPTALLINSRTDVALAVQATGVHLRSHDITPQEVHAIWQRPCGTDTHVRVSPGNPTISISCHSKEEVMQAAASQATLALFAPVFEKKNSPAATPAGLETLRQACRAKIPVLALGGITLGNAASGIAAGAAGIAAIRLFQENDIATIARELRKYRG